MKFKATYEPDSTAIIVPDKVYLALGPDARPAVAITIAGMPRLAVYAAKESVNRAFETSLAEGLKFERRLFHSTFGTADQKEGMSAFAEKRPAKFTNR